MHVRKREFAASDLLLALTMLAFVALPLAGALWSGTHSAESQVEKRRLATRPPWPGTMSAWVQFPKAFDAYARDQFGFRHGLLSGYRWLLASVFHQSASPNAFIGRAGWLYLTLQGALEDMQGIDPYSYAELRNDVQQINARGELLAVRGIRYGFVVFPDKHTIYPQFLPPGLYGGFARRRLTALDAAMAQTGHAYYFDATGSLQQDAKNSPFPLYYKSDTHWNAWGAYLGYRAWQAEQGKRLGLERFQYQFGQFRKPARSMRGDLAVMSRYRPHDPDLYPPDGAGCESLKQWTAPAAVADVIDTPPNHLGFSACGGSGNALVVHDSFVYSIARYVSASYAHTWYVWKYLDDPAFAQAVRSLRPDVVIVQRVERLMQHLRPLDLDALVQELGIMGEGAVVAGNGDLVLGESNSRRVFTRERIGGALERVVRDGDRLRVEGWASMDASSPDAVLVVANGVVVGEGPVALFRPDLAEAKRHTALAWSGYQLSIPVKALTAKGPELRWFVVGPDTYGELPLDAQDQRRMSGALELGPQMVGRSVTFDERQRLVVAGDGRTMTRARAPVGGSLDEIVREGDTIHLVGWGRVAGASASAIIAVRAGRVVGEAPVTLHREDVADALENPALLSSGFELTLPVSAAGSDINGLSFYLLDSGGYGNLPMGPKTLQRLRTLVH